MLKARIATAVALLGAFLLAIFLLPTRQFAVVVGIVVALGAFEWAALVKLGAAGRYAFAAACAGLFGIVVWLAEAVDPSRPGLVWLYVFASAFWLLVAPFWLALRFRLVSRVPALAAGAVVVLPAALATVSLHSVSPGMLLTVFGLIWIADTAAYFSGRRFGRHKLVSSISPGKTWEGAVGALAATLIYATICARISPQLRETVRGSIWAPYLLVVALLCAVGIVGDLFESWVKRLAQVKDSGTLLPGHGGVLDRIDSVTSTLPVAALLFHVMVGGA